MEELKRKVKIVSDFAINSAMKQLGDGPTVSLAAGIGLMQGLKYNGSLKRGIKAGLATMGVAVGVNIVVNLARNWENIKK